MAWITDISEGENGETGGEKNHQWNNLKRISQNYRKCISILKAPIEHPSQWVTVDLNWDRLLWIFRLL